MNRRTALSSVGALISVGVAGCLFNEDESEAIFSLQEVRSFQADAGTAVVVCTVKKESDSTGNVTIEAQLLIDDAYDRAVNQTFVISERLDYATVALPFTSDSAFYEEHTFTARAKIVRQDKEDSEWITETGMSSDSGQ